MKTNENCESRLRSNISLEEYMLIYVVTATLNALILMKVWAAKVFSMDSSAVAVMVAMVAVLATAFLELSCNRNYRSVYNAVASGLFPFAATAFLSLLDIKPVLSTVLSVIAVALIIFGVVKFRRSPGLLVCYIRNALCLTFAVSLIMVICAGAGLMSLYPVKPYVIPDFAEPPTTSQSEWEHMSKTERSDFLADVIAFECNHLGIGPPKLVFSTLPSTTLGKYTHENRCIAIQAELINHGTAGEITLAAIHEVRHCYQQEVALLYDRLKDTEYAGLYPISLGRLIAEENSQQKTSFDDYYHSASETDARTYSERYLNIYYKEE